MNLQEFESASKNLENYLLYIQRAETLARLDQADEAYKTLLKAASLATIYQSLRQYEDQLASVSDSNAASHGPGKPFYKPSVHAAVGSLGVTITQLFSIPGYDVPKNLCEFLKVNVSELRSGLQRERARLLAEEPAEIDDTVWLKQVDVARGLDVPPVNVQRLCEQHHLQTNGKTGPEKRIDEASVISHAKELGLSYLFGKA